MSNDIENQAEPQPGDAIARRISRAFSFSAIIGDPNPLPGVQAQVNPHQPGSADTGTAPPQEGIGKKIVRALTFSSPIGIPLPRAVPPGFATTAGRAGIDAEVWQTYVSEAAEFDKTLIESWNEDLDVLLIFAGLFSGVLTAFIIESRQDLQEDYSKTSALLLSAIVDQSRNVSFTPPPPFTPTSNALHVNALWFASLGCSLFSALAAMLGKQWVRQYTNNLLVGGAYVVRARRHQSALRATQRWKMSQVIHAIPLFIHLALFLFFIGLFIFIWGDNPVIVATILPINLACVLIYIVLTILPSIRPDCPFRTPLSHFIPLRSKNPSQGLDNHLHSPGDLDTKCLGWLMQSTSTSIVCSAATAISGLEGTVSQQAILHKSGAFEGVIRSLVSCTFEERGLLVINHKDMDTASLLLFAALRLLNAPSDPSNPWTSRQALIDFLKRFNTKRIISLRQTFNAADFAAAMWCLVAFNYLQKFYRDSEPSNCLASEFIETIRIPDHLETPASNRLHKNLLRPAIELAFSTPSDNPQLFAWAVEAMFMCWRIEGLFVAFDEVGNSVVSRAVTTSEPDTGNVMAAVVHKLRIQGREMLSTGAMGPILEAAKVNDPLVAVPAIWILEQFDYHTISVTEVLPTIFEVISSRQDVIAVRVMFLLSRISSMSIPGARAIVEAGPIELFVNALDSSQPDIASLAETILEKTLTSSLLFEVVLATGVIGQLVEKMMSGNVSTSTSQALQMISSHEKGAMAVIAAGAVRPLVTALRSTESKIVICAMNVIYEIAAYSTGLSAILEAGVVHRLSAVVRSNTVAVALSAIATLRAISVNANGNTAMIETTLIQSLVDAATTEEDDIVGPTTSVIESMSERELRIIERLVGPAGTEGILIRSTAAMEILRKILQHERGISAMIEADDVIARLLNTLSSNDPRSQVSAVEVLKSLSQHEHTINTLIEAGAIEQLMIAMTSLRPGISSSVMKILSNIAKHVRGIDAIIEAGALVPLAEALRSHDPYTQLDAFHVYATILDHDQSVDTVFASRAVGELIRIAKLREDYSVLSKLLLKGGEDVSAAMKDEIAQYLVDDLESGTLQSRLEAQEAGVVESVLKILLAISNPDQDVNRGSIDIPANAFEFFHQLSASNSGEASVLASRFLARNEIQRRDLNEAHADDAT